MSLRRVVQAILALAMMAGPGNHVVQAASLCVHPTGAGQCFTSVQAAVDAASDGDRIIIRAGTYAEQVTILDKDLTLIGQSGAVIQAPAGMADTVSPVAGAEGRPIVLVTQAEVTIRDLTIDGANSAEDNPALQGITFINASGVIRHNLIKDIGFGEPRLPIVDGIPRYQGEGIVVVNLEATPRTVTIAENRVVNYNSSGITVFAQADPNNPAFENLTAHVLNNTVVGLGLNDVIDQWGIFFGGFGFPDPQFSITGTMRGNRIHDQVKISSFPLPGVGIVTFNTYDVEIAQNVIENVNVGLDAPQFVLGQIIGNEMNGPREDITGSHGLRLAGLDARVAQNRFNRQAIGILLYVDHPDFGNALNTSLHENRFENVLTDVVTGPVVAGAATARIEQIQTRFAPR